jgi:transposase
MDFTEENFKILLEKSQRQEAEIRVLTQKLQYLLNQHFGSKSEKIHPDQLPLAFGTDDVSVGAPEAALEVEEVSGGRKKKKRKKLAERLPDNLPIEEHVIEPEEVLANPAAYKRIGEEILDELDIVPAKFFIRRIIRPKYVEIDNRNLPPVIASAPKRIIDNSYVSAGLLTYIILNKYCDHLPLYRLEQIFKKRYGAEISRKTMSDWMYRVSQMLAQIYEAMREELRTLNYLQIDETPVKYQNPGNGRCSKGYLWVYLAPKKAVLFDWYTSRASNCLDAMLHSYNGIVQSDGYNAYNAFLKNNENSTIELAACWAHARRKFYAARNESTFAAQIVKQISKLYRIESQLREDPQLDRKVTRQEQSVPILKEIKEQLCSEQSKHMPQSLTRTAINYTLQLWDKLIVYTQHSEVEIDNNLVENSIRPTAIGKKNWLFFGSADAGQTSAILYSLIETCRMLNINPQEYLLSIFTALPTMTNHTAKNYTPEKWQADCEDILG